MLVVISQNQTNPNLKSKAKKIIQRTVPLQNNNKEDEVESSIQYPIYVHTARWQMTSRLANISSGF